MRERRIDSQPENQRYWKRGDREGMVFARGKRGPLPKKEKVGNRSGKALIDLGNEKRTRVTASLFKVGSAEGGGGLERNMNKGGKIPCRVKKRAKRNMEGVFLLLRGVGGVM